MSVLGEQNKKRTARSEIVSVLMDQEAVTERTRLEEILLEAVNTDRDAPKDARLGKPKDSPEVVEARAALDGHLARMADAVVHVRVTAMPNPRWRQLQAGFPPRRGHKPDDVGYNVEEVTRKTLELFSHVSVDQENWEKPDADEVKEFLEDLPGGEFANLFWTVHRLNESPVNTGDLKKG